MAYTRYSIYAVARKNDFLSDLMSTANFLQDNFSYV